jgi:hypothetical protein
MVVALYPLGNSDKKKFNMDIISGIFLLVYVIVQNSELDYGIFIHVYTLMGWDFPLHPPHFLFPKILPF